MKLWVLGIYENETDKQPAQQGYALADTLEEIEERVKNNVPGAYKLVTLDISDSSAFNSEAFPPNGILWSPFPVS
jgi:hypothetical protein